MKRWMRRNGVALITLAVLAPVGVFVLSGVELLDRAGRVTEPVTAAGPDEPAESDGLSARVVNSAEFVGEGDGEGGNGIPIGLALVATLTEISADRDVSCTPDLTTGSGEARRTWPSLSAPERFGYGYGDDTAIACSLDAGETIELETVFLTPVGTYPDSVLELTVTSEGARSVLRLPLR